VNQDYHRTVAGESPRPKPPRHGVIDAARDNVPVEQLAAELTTIKRAGKEFSGRCPLHEEKTPSFYVSPEKGVFHCHGCKAGGDVVTLAQLAWKIERPEVAAAEVLLYFGLEVPARPPAWFRKQERQRPVRNSLDEMKIRALRRTLYRIVDPLIAHDEDAAKTWEECLPLARLWLRRIEEEAEK
jgi:hypothetical protein